MPLRCRTRYSPGRISCAGLVLAVVIAASAPRCGEFDALAAGWFQECLAVAEINNYWYGSR